MIQFLRFGNQKLLKIERIFPVFYFETDAKYTNTRCECVINDINKSKNKRDTHTPPLSVIFILDFVYSDTSDSENNSSEKV